MVIALFLPSALPSSYSCVCSLALSLLTFAAMQVFRERLSAERSTTILGGFVGSVFFMFLLTVSIYTLEIMCAILIGAHIVFVNRQLVMDLVCCLEGVIR